MSRLKYFKKKNLIKILGKGREILKKKKGVIFLMYHHIIPDGIKSDYPYTVTVRHFEEQMRYLKEKFNILHADDLIERIKTENIDDLNIGITFDDGYKTNYSLAYPILKEYNIPATFFVTTNFIGKEYETFLNWHEIKEMASCELITFGSHCCWHFNLHALTRADVIKEIKQSKLILEDKLGKRIDYLSYPGGNHNEDIMKIAKNSGYKAAFKDRVVPKKENNNPYALGRISIEKANESMSDFIATLAATETIKSC